MRLHITLTPTKKTPQPLNQHHIQGALYTIFKSIGYKEIHNEERYKYFCFSNIFPFKKGEPFAANSDLNFFISSPRKELIESLRDFFRFKPELLFGEYPFKTLESKIITPHLAAETILTAGTPIVCSIPHGLYPKYGIQSERELLYWTNKFPLNAFVDLISHNLVRKYNRYYETSLDENMVLFRKFRYNNFAVIPYKTGEVAASYWEFPLEISSPTIRALLEFGLDCGFGEKNSAGFGFMNIKRTT